MFSFGEYRLLVILRNTSCRQENKYRSRAAFLNSRQFLYNANSDKPGFGSELNEYRHHVMSYKKVSTKICLAIPKTLWRIF
jgi:hypothetical protein